MTAPARLLSKAASVGHLFTPKLGQPSGNRLKFLRRRWGVTAKSGCSHAQTDHGFGQPHGTSNPVQHRKPMFSGQPVRQIGHSRTAQNDSLSPVLFDGTSDFGADAVAGIRSRMLEFQNGDL